MAQSPDQEPLKLQNYVPALINILSSRLTASSTATYRQAVGLSALELRVLVALADGQLLSAQQIVEVVGQDKGPVSRCLKRLDERGLVMVRSADRGHRHDIAITPAGRALYGKAMPLALARQERLLQDFTPADRQRLVSDLKQMIARLDAVAAPYLLDHDVVGSGQHPTDTRR